MNQTNDPLTKFLTTLTSAPAVDDFTKRYNEALVEKAEADARKAKAEADISETLLAYYKKTLAQAESQNHFPALNDPFQS